MANSYSKQMRERIDSAADGTIFINSDFADIANTQTVRRILYGFTQTGILHRVLKGVYQKPEYSELIKEYVAPDPDEVAKALARNFHWTIAPSGNTALNFLGLSTQVPAVWEYLSDGPSKTYEWDNTKVTFKHRTNREITGLSYGTLLVVHALKAMGKEYVTPKTIRIIRRRLSEEDMAVLLREASECTDWVYDTIREIAGKTE